MMQTALDLATPTEQEGTREEILGPMSLRNIPHHPNLLQLADLHHPLPELNAIRILRHLGSLQIRQHRREPKLGEAHMKHGRE
jgi:hypothetical protein